MAPSAIIPDLPLPPQSAVQKSIGDSSPFFQHSAHPAYLQQLASNILHDLQFQHDWTSLTIHTHSTANNLPLPRPIISGLPPRRVYVHPDEQVQIIKAEHEMGESIEQRPEREWVLPSQIQEEWSVAKFAEVFDALDVLPPAEDGENEEEPDELAVGHEWQGTNRPKRLLLATATAYEAHGSGRAGNVLRQMMSRPLRETAIVRGASIVQPN
ncbi:Uncharacterized protein BP5553_00501 [Venustampulla echinocandica]|uniref:tRNA-splicing endonuclease subunit Sen15 domain-containing protein n=1 Tax=Venustampulla echinocandica TaxID=2656787 RepID=A0A370TYD1_9HELO|nr:Uncharacterized protein BP5553_00501 [Venustampulla echinocandica]RDL40522.1 Uncharacterized protein BP5553_00501 [Venustampulla echinocandica]